METFFAEYKRIRCIIVLARIHLTTRRRVSAVLVVSEPQGSTPDPGPGFAFHAAQSTSPGDRRAPHGSLGVRGLPTTQVEGRYNRQHKTNHRFSPKHCDDHHVRPEFSVQLWTQRKAPGPGCFLKSAKWLISQSTARLHAAPVCKTNVMRFSEVKIYVLFCF